MKQRFASVRRSALATIAASAAVLSLFSSSAQAQGKGEVGNLTFDNIPSPEVQSGKQKAFKPKDWLEVEAGMKLPAANAEQKKIGFINEVTVKWYIAVKNPDGKGVIKLAKTINHINVPIDEEVFTSVYMSPSSLKRLTGTDKASVFFDRGVPDTIGYLRLCGLPAPDHVTSAARKFRYAQRVFVAPPWPEIFTRDEERRQTLDEAERTFRSVTGVYAELGYELTPLPLAPVQERMRFVLDRVGLCQA